LSEQLIRELGLPIGTFVLCFLSAIIPLIHAELYLITVSALSPPAGLPVLALLAALGQMLGKCVMYLSGMGILKIPQRRFQAAMARYQEKVTRWRQKPDILIFVSSFTGLPPFFFISILAGTMRIPFARFWVVGFVGRLLRFSLALAFPQAVKSLLG